MTTSTKSEDVEALAAKHASLAAGSEACIDYRRADESMLVYDTLRALLAERDALREAIKNVDECFFEFVCEWTDPYEPVSDYEVSVSRKLKEFGIAIDGARSL